MPTEHIYLNIFLYILHGGGQTNKAPSCIRTWFSISVSVAEEICIVLYVKDQWIILLFSMIPRCLRTLSCGNYTH